MNPESEHHGLETSDDDHRTYRAWCHDNQRFRLLMQDSTGVPAVVDELPREAILCAGKREFTARVRIDTPTEADYFRHRGILEYVLRDLLAVPGARS